MSSADAYSVDMATHAQFSQIDVWSLGYLLVTQWLSLVYGIPTPEQFNTLGNLHKEFLAWLGTTMSTVRLHLSSVDYFLTL